MGRKWTAEERQRQAQLIKSWRPWNNSTGAVTKKGREASKMNAMKHGMRSAKNLQLSKEWKTLAESKIEKCILPRRALNYKSIDFVPDYQRGLLRPNPEFRIKE